MALFASLLLFAALAQDPASEELKKEVDRLKADNEVLLRQLKELSETMPKLEAVKTPLSPQDQLRQEQWLRAVRSAYLEAQELLRARNPETPAPAPVKPGQEIPRKPVDPWVTAIAPEIGMVVISAGKDDRVQVGDEFTVYRKTEFVAKIKIDRADHKWSAGKVISKRSEPRVGDLVSNSIFVTAKVAEPVPAPVVPAPARHSVEELRSIRKELDDVLAQVRVLSDRVIPSWKNEGLALEEASEPVRSQLKIDRGLMVRQVREGSPAAKFGFKPFDVVADRSEDQVLRAVKEGGKVTIYRQGSLETLQGDRSR